MSEAYINFGPDDQGEFIVAYDPILAFVSLKVETENGSYERKHKISEAGDVFGITRMYRPESEKGVGDLSRLLPRYVDAEVTNDTIEESGESYVIEALMEGEELFPKTGGVAIVKKTDGEMYCEKTVAGATTLFSCDDSKKTTGHKVTDTAIRDLVDMWVDIPDESGRGINNVFPDKTTMEAVRAISRYVVERAEELEEMRNQQQTS